MTKIRKEYVDFETRKSVHINLSKETHASVRSYLFNCHLSMQEVFEELAIQIVEEQPHMLNAISDIIERKRNKVVRKLSKADADNIYSLIDDDRVLNNSDSDDTI